MEKKIIFQSPDGNDQTYFALVSLGLEKPLVCHGSGMTVDYAADNAAYNAIVSLSRMNDPPVAIFFFIVFHKKFLDQSCSSIIFLT